jgi:hypothetical protein
LINTFNSQCSLGVLYCSADSFEYALDAFEKAVACDHRQTRAFLNHGQLLDHHFMKQARTDEERAECHHKAVHSYQRVLKLAPDNDHARARLEALGVDPDLTDDEPREDTESQSTGTTSKRDSVPFDDASVRSFAAIATPLTWRQDSQSVTTPEEQFFTPLPKMTEQTEMPFPSMPEEHVEGDVSPTEWPVSVEPMPENRLKSPARVEFLPAQIRLPETPEDRSNSPAIGTFVADARVDRMQNMLDDVLQRQKGGSEGALSSHV